MPKPFSTPNLEPRQQSAAGEGCRLGGGRGMWSRPSAGCLCVISPCLSSTSISSRSRKGACRAGPSSPPCPPPLLAPLTLPCKSRKRRYPWEAAWALARRIRVSPGASESAPARPSQPTAECEIRVSPVADRPRRIRIWRAPKAPPAPNTPERTRKGARDNVCIRSI